MFVCEKPHGKVEVNREAGKSFLFFIWLNIRLYVSLMHSSPLGGLVQYMEQKGVQPFLRPGEETKIVHPGGFSQTNQYFLLA
jgi:hypothetical protein